MTCVDDVLVASANLEQMFAYMNKYRCSKCPTRYAPPNPALVQRGCCGGCARARGHGSDDTYMKLREKYWVDWNYGFFNPVNLRCNLPRPLRSQVCLRYNCIKYTYPGSWKHRFARMLQDISETHLDMHLDVILSFRQENPDTWVEQIEQRLQSAPMGARA